MFGSQLLHWPSFGWARLELNALPDSPPLVQLLQQAIRCTESSSWYCCLLPKQCLLCSQDLHGGGGVLGQTGETASVRDQSCSNLGGWGEGRRGRGGKEGGREGREGGGGGEEGREEGEEGREGGEKEEVRRREKKVITIHH